MISSKPSQYIKGWVEFYKLKFKVTSDVLIPRPETELLVDEVLRWIKDQGSRIKKKVTINFRGLKSRGFPSKFTSASQFNAAEDCNLLRLHPRSKERGFVEAVIIDLGTGAGNIAISIAKNLSFHPKGLPAGQAGVKVKIIATDISQKALKVARQNAKLHGVSDKITFIQSNLLSNLRMHPNIIVTNLPYIPSARIPYLDSSVKDFEPHIALDGGKDGFELYRKLFRQIQDKGWKPNLIVCEIDYTHGEIGLREAQKLEARAEVKTDLAKKQRILLIKLTD